MTKEKTKLEYEEGDILEVRWLDTTEQQAWVSLNQARLSTPTEVKSVGWLIVETKDSLCLAYSITADGDCSHTTYPKGCLLSITRLETGELDDFEEKE